jgi:hypothetical protein
MRTITLSGQSGASHVFEVFPLDGALPPLPVVYFVFEQSLTGTGHGSQHAVYVGHAPDAATCMDDHHRQCFVANGATHIGLHVEYDETSRAEKVSDLVRALAPVCNG